MQKLIIGITGASGSIYAKNLIAHANELSIDLRIIASAMGEAVFKHETSLNLQDFLKSLQQRNKSQITLYNNKDMFADIASGSYKTDGMVIIPCSMKTLATVANGFSGSLMERAADVTLKERRKLILVVRETPLSLIHLRNMTLATESGAVILPASPGFYNNPQSIDSLADFISSKVFDQLNIKHELPFWDGSKINSLGK